MININAAVYVRSPVVNFARQPGRLSTVITSNQDFKSRRYGIPTVFARLHRSSMHTPHRTCGKNSIGQRCIHVYPPRTSIQHTRVAHAQLGTTALHITMPYTCPAGLHSTFASLDNSIMRMPRRVATLYGPAGQQRFAHAPLCNNTFNMSRWARMQSLP